MVEKASPPVLVCKVLRNNDLYVKYSGIRSYAPKSASFQFPVHGCTVGLPVPALFSFFKEPIVLSDLCALLLSLDFLLAKSRSFCREIGGKCSVVLRLFSCTYRIVRELLVPAMCGEGSKAPTQSQKARLNGAPGEFSVKLRYLHRNSVKRGLVAHSSHLLCSVS